VDKRHKRIVDAGKDEADKLGVTYLGLGYTGKTHLKLSFGFGRHRFSVVASSTPKNVDHTVKNVRRDIKRKHHEAKSE
jgi:hypothetical protein